MPALQPGDQPAVISFEVGLNLGLWIFGLEFSWELADRMIKTLKENGEL